MKKIIIGLFISIIMLCGFSVAQVYFDVTTGNSMASCISSESEDVYYYLTSDGFQEKPSDTFGVASGATDVAIGGAQNGSSVRIWRHGVITKCNTWARVSNVAAANDANGVLAVKNTDNCKFNIPSYLKTGSNATAVDAQIHFTIGYLLIDNNISSWPSHSRRLYHRDYGNSNWDCYPNGPYGVSDYSSCNPTTVHHTSGYYLHTGECINYRIFWCGDGLVNGRDKNGTVITNYTNGPFTEQCDPNDPTHAGRGNGGCSPYCQPINNTQPPVCNTAYSGTHYVNNPAYPNWLTESMNLCSQGTVVPGSLTHRWGGNGHVGHYGWSCTNSAGTIGCQANQQRCGDGLLQSNEQCDPGSGNFGNGCNSSCQLMVPECTLTVNPSQGNIPLNTTINGTKPSWATYLTLNFGDGSPLQNNPTFALNHTYNSTGTFNLTLTIQNNYNGQVNGTKPTATCSANVATTQPGSPVPYLLKQQKTGGMANFTTNQINVEIGDIITYKVNFGNSGTVAATGEVRDILPPCVNYITSSIQLPAGVAANGPTVTPYGSQYMVKYENFRLQPGQGGYMLVQVQVRGTGTNGTTSCQNVTSYLNTGYFKFVGGNTLSSQVIAVRPQAPQSPHLTIVKELLTTGNVSVGDYVGYKITLRNIGSGIAYNAYILDTMPRALQYVSSTINGVTNYLFTGWTDTYGQYNVKYYNFNLAPNQSAVVYLTGRLLDGYSFGDLTNCAFTSGANDCVIISGSPVPYLLKQQKTGGMANFTSNQINVQLGETITYRVNFGNSGTVAATGQVRDILPPCVNYITSSIHLPAGVTANGPTVIPYGSQYMVKYENFRLQPGQGGYMLVQVQVRGTGTSGMTSCQNVTSYLNTGYFKFLGGNTLSSQVIAIRPNTSSNVIFDKTGNKSLMYPGETGLEFYITVTNQGPNSISNIYVEDIWPDNETCIIYDGWTGTKIEEVSHLRRHYIGSNAGGNQGGTNGKGGGDEGRTNLNNGGGGEQTSNGILYAGQSFNFTIFAHVADNPSCVGPYVNTGKLTYTEGGTSHELYDDYPFQVVTTPNIKVSIVKTVDHQYVNHNDTVTYTITYTNNGTAPLTNYVIKDYWPAMVQFISSTPYTNDVVVNGDGTVITWHFSTPLGVGESATITAVGRVR